jgi:hypothetical protein
LENNLPAPARSCEGEPAPDRVLLAILLAAPSPGGGPKVERRAEADVGSTGDVLAWGEVDRVWDADWVG